MATSSIAVAAVFLCTIIGAFGALFLKEASAKISLQHLLNKKLIFGILCYGTGMFINIAALRFGDLSVLYPLNSLTYIWVTLLSKYRLKEDINKFKIAGIALIILGVSVIGFSR